MRPQLQALRAAMAARGIDAYLVPTADPHGSEYVGDHFACRAWVSGFTGSAGTLLVFPQWAGLWTDGRYFLQARDQLAGSGIRLMEQGQPGVPTIEDFLRDSLQHGQVLGFDGRCLDAWTGSRYAALARRRGPCRHDEHGQKRSGVDRAAAAVVNCGDARFLSAMHEGKLRFPWRRRAAAYSQGAKRRAGYEARRQP